MQLTFKELSHIKSWRYSYVLHLQWTFTAHGFESHLWFRGPGDFCLNKRTILPTGTSFQGYINSNSREISIGKKQMNSFSNSALGSRFDR